MKNKPGSRFSYYFWNFIKILGLSCLLVSPHAISAANKISTISTNSTSSYKLNKLIKIETVVMQGNRPTFNFYIPIPKNWQVNSIDLNLIIENSGLLENVSTLTMSIGNTPINSIVIGKDKQQPISWNVTIPKEYITPKVTTVTLSGWLKIGDKICQDTENKGNWVTISGNSEIVYHYGQSNWKPVLSDFPAPFINLNAPYQDEIALLLPNQLTDTSFFPYFDLANILAQKASWRGVNFDLIHPNEMGRKALSQPAILAATANNADFTLYGQPPLLRLQNKKWVNSDGTVLPDGTGFIWLTQYNQQPLLVISSNSAEGLNNTIQNLRSGWVQKLGNDPSFFLVKDKININNFDFSQQNATVTFQDLGYKDNVVYGVGQNSLSYQFNIPAQYYGKNNSVNILYSYSPFLDKSKLSSMSVNLNGVPISGVELMPNTADIKTLKLYLPANQILIGKNNLTINYMLSLSNSWCSKDYLNQAWGIIYQNSNFQFDSEGNNDVLHLAQLKNWPYFIAGNVFIALPTEADAYKNEKLLNSLITFSSNLRNKTSFILINPKLEQSKNNAYTTVLFTTAKSQVPSMEYLKKMFLKLNNPGLNDLDKSVFANAFVKSQGIGFATIGQDVINPNDRQMIFYGYSPTDLYYALRLLNNDFKRESLSGDLALSFENGSFTSLSSEVIKNQTASETTLTKVSQNSANMILYGFLSLIVLGIIIFIWKKMEKNDKDVDLK